MGGSKSQTLITGVYRTGSEYIAQIAGCHPLLVVSMYSVNALRFLYGRFDPIELPARYQAALSALATRLRVRYHRDLPKQLILKRLEAVPKVTYGVLYDEIMCALYVRAPAEHWAEKNQLLWREIPSFLESMPNGRAVLVLRDPRSVVTSFKRYTYAPPPAYLGAIFNCYDSMQFASSNDNLEASGQLLTVRYEDAAIHPQATAERIWSFLGLAGSYDVNDQNNWRDAYGKPWHVNSSFHANNDERPFEVNSAIERWRGTITDGELALTELVCGSLMEKYGYRLSGGGPDRAIAIEAIGGDPEILRYLERWEIDGEGIEAFPTDPLDPTNWRND